MTRRLLILALLLVIATSGRAAGFPASPPSGTPQRAAGQDADVVASGVSFPSVALQPTNAPANVSVTGSITGQATWYRYHSGQSAAGPALRRWLGKSWRGTTVVVCAGRCITTRLTDRMMADRLVDLDRRDFARLASPSVGVLRVTVSRLPDGPPTDVTP